MDYRKIAKIFKGALGFYIWRQSEDAYWLTDTYFLIKLNRETFLRFKAKYSSYTNTPLIEDLEIGKKLNIYENNIENENGPDIEKVLDDSKAKEVTITHLAFAEDYGKNMIIYIVGGELGVFQKEYFELFGYGRKYRSEGIDESVFVYDRYEIIGVVMPVRNGSIDGFDDLNMLKKALSGN